MKSQITSVLYEYIQLATPCIGEYTIQAKRIMKNREEYNMDLLYHSFGGDIVALQEINGYKIKNPDFCWNGTLWEEQEPIKHTKNAIDKNIREGIHQISRNPGGIVLDIGNSDMDITSIETIALHRLNRSSDFNCDIVIIRNGKIEEIFRYKK